MIAYSSKYRSSQEEIMDDFDLQGEELKLLLTDLRLVNTWLGGNKITRKGIRSLLKNIPKGQSVTIIDVGCGDGEMIRHCARWAKKNKLKLEFIGIDANPHIINEARLRSHGYKNCTFRIADVCLENDSLPAYDIALCTLFLHHFKDGEVANLLKRLSKQSKLGVVVNDLHRHSLAFYLFKLFSHVFLKTDIAKHDGLVSVASSFKKRDLIDISESINGTHSITWKWAFRWQWIISKN